MTKVNKYKMKQSPMFKKHIKLPYELKFIFLSQHFITHTCCVIKI